MLLGLNNKRLTEEELRDLFIQYKNGNKEAREKIILSNTNLVAYVYGKKFANNHNNRKDLISCGLVGLIKAVDNFNLSKENKFSSFACVCINNEMLQYIRNNNKHKELISLEYENEKNHKVFFEVLKDENVNIEEDYARKEEKTKLIEIIKKLDYKEQLIINLYFGFSGTPLSQKEIADLYQVSQSFMSRKIARILYKIKNELTGKVMIKEKK